MNRTLLVIGSSGLLGSALLAKGKSAGFQVIGADIGGIDITQPESITAFFDHVHAEGGKTVVVNAAAYTDVEGAETSEGFAIASRVNSDGPGHLARICKERNLAFIHLSTDYVFNGTNNEGVTEDTIPAEAMNAYGKTKRMGELAMIDIYGGLNGSDFACKQFADDSDCRAYLVRLSWLFGPGAKNFVAKVVERAKSTGEVSIVDDEVGCPLYVEDLSNYLFDLIREQPVSGIYHAAGQGSCSRFDFAKRVLDCLHISAIMNPCKLADFPRKAHIANVSVLRSTKRPQLRPWQSMVEAYAESFT